MELLLILTYSAICVAIFKIFKIGLVGERHEGGEATSRWQANPSHCFLIGENDGSACKAISADELENIEALLGHDAGEWASVQYQT